MTVLREMVARLGFEVDKSGFAAAIKGIGNVQTALRETARGADRAQQAAAEAQRKAAGAADSTSGLVKNLRNLAASVGLSHLVGQMVEMASSADETQNILLQLFGPQGLTQVNAWAADMADKMGRSRYALMEFAGQIGAVVAPVISSKDKVREMSQSFAQLAVDLGSFYNSSDEDAARALRSGLTGEYESLKRYGIVLNDSTLQEIAHSRGISTKVTAMSVAQKTELRYAAIMKLTTAAQGDAERTGKGFANASKGLWASLRDLGTMMGQSVLPTIEKLIGASRQALHDFKDLAANTYFLKAAMWALIGVAGWLALELVGAFVLPAVAILAMVVAVDQLRATFAGGKSLIRDWLDSWLGAEKAAHVIDEMRRSVDLLVASVQALTGSQGALRALYKLAPKSVLGEWARDQLQEQQKLSKGGMGAFSAPENQGLQRVIELAPNSAAAALARRQLLDRGESIRRDPRSSPQVRPTGMYSVVPEEPRASPLRYPDDPGSRLRGVYPGGWRADQPFESEVVAPPAYTYVTADPLRAAAGGGGGAPVTVNVGPTTATINVANGDPVKIKQAVTEVLDERDRAAAAAIPGGAR